MGEQHGTGDGEAEGEEGLVPALPESLISEKQRNLVELMTRLHPAERMKMGFVVESLARSRRTRRQRDYRDEQREVRDGVRDSKCMDG